MSSRKLGNLIRIKTGKLDANASSEEGEYPFFTCSRTPLKIDSYSYDCKCVLVAGNGDLNVKFYEGKFDAYQRTYIVESLDEETLNTRYLFWFLEKYIEKLRKLSIGGVIKYIKLNNLTDPDIPLPPLEDQKRIVKILDQADDLRQKRKQAIELLDEYVKSVFLEMFGDPVSNPKGWDTLRMKNILLKIESGKSPKCLGRKANSGEWGVLKLGAITQCEYKPFENKALPSNEPPRRDIEVKKGDVLFSRKNTQDLIAACAYVWETPNHLMMPDLIFRLVIKNKEVLNPIYFQGLLSNTSKRKVIQSLSGGAAGSMPNISKTKLLEALVEIPPISLQNHYSKIVVKVESLKQKMIQQSQELDNQFQALMQKAFKGEL